MAHKGPPPPRDRTPDLDIDQDAEEEKRAAAAAAAAAAPRPAPAPAPAAAPPDPIAEARAAWLAHLNICNMGCQQDGPRSCPWGTTIWHDMPAPAKVGLVEEFTAARAERMRAAQKPGT
jgi:hypothetical protein